MPNLTHWKALVMLDIHAFALPAKQRMEAA